MAKRRWPMIINKTVEVDDAAASGSWIAYFERRGGNAEPLSPAELQQLLRDGQRTSAIEQRFDAFDEQLRGVDEQIRAVQVPQAPLAQVAPPFVPPPPALPSEAVQSYQRRLKEAITATGLGSAPVFSLVAAPADTIRLPTLFRGTDDPLVRLLTYPPGLRPGGFDMPEGETAIVEGKLRRKVLSRAQLLECWRDGTIIFVTDASEFLSWGMQAPVPRMVRINSLALVESTLMFATLAHRVYAQHSKPSPHSIEFRLGLDRMNAGGRRAVLPPHRPRSFAAMLPLAAHEAPQVEHEVVEHTPVPFEPGEIAYRLIAGVYTWFGLEENVIPYVGEQDGARVISTEAILGER